MARNSWTGRVVLAAFVVLAGAAGLALAADAQRPKNLLANPNFELGPDPWNMDTGRGTEARFTVDKENARDAEYSALVTVDKVADYGVQLGQDVPGGRVGRTYTFALLAKSVGGPVTVGLTVQRNGNPYDSAGNGDPVTLEKDHWTELHITFKVQKPFAEGWFAFVYCTQAKCQFRVRGTRLYEGEYVAYQKEAQAVAADAGVRLFDTGAASAEPLSPAALSQRSGWTQLPEDQVSHEFAGDVVFQNNRVALALRRGARGAELYSAGAEGWKQRAVLVPVGQGETDPGKPQFSSAKIVENDSGNVTVEAAFQAEGKPLAVRYELKVGQLFVKTEPKEGTRALRLEAPCRFAVLPDFFADDIVLDATELPVSRAELPSENFLLEMLEGNDAVLMSVWTEQDQDAAVTLNGQEASKRIDGAETQYGAKGNVWVAVMAAPQIWHVRDIGKEDTDKVIPLDWRQPFPAVWRVDWHGADRLADSWEMIMERPDGKFSKFSWFRGMDTLPADRSRWATVLREYQYPCWIDKDGRGNLQPQKFEHHAQFEGPTLIYPIFRLDDTPLDAYTVVDVVRATLGVGPCEYILDVEGQTLHWGAIATCGCRDTLMPIYEQHQQAQEKARIEETLTDVMVFVRFIRSRIEAYVTFGHDLSKYLADCRQAHPELAGQIKELEQLTNVIGEKYTEVRDTIKTPDETQELVDTFRKDHLTDETPQAADACDKFTKALVEIGGTQDELVGECRQAVRVLREQAGIAMAMDGRMAEVSKEIRKRSQEMLRNPTGHESPRH
jgi:hypothetical protein